jgi:hypothetical protein
MTTPTFGEFIDPARGHIRAAVSFTGELDGDAKRGVIQQLHRTVATLARYLSDMPVPDEFHPAAGQLEPPARAALHARIALRRAALSLRHATQAFAEPQRGLGHPAAVHLGRAAEYLSAGRDLLQTHFASSPHGIRAGRSHWAPAITAPPVTAALLAEITDHARRLAPWAARVSMAGPTGSDVPAEASLALHAASKWLWIAANGISIAHTGQPISAPGHRLLRAIPAHTLPPRPTHDAPAPVPVLCDAITVTAERLRYLTAAFAQRVRWSRTTTSLSWRRTAMAAAITGHTSETLLTTLSQRANDLLADSALAVELSGAADAMKHTWAAWRTIATHWDTISTGIDRRAALTPVAAELDHLILGLGRLTHRNPHWTPACTDASDGRSPADLAPVTGDLNNVLSAIHHAADATARIAASDREAVRQAAADHRLYIPTRLLPENCDVPYPYAPALPGEVDILLDAYDAVIETSQRTVAALDRLATELGCPSDTLAAIRALSPPLPQAVARQGNPLGPAANHVNLPSPVPHPGKTARHLHTLGITDPTMLLRATAIDTAAQSLIHDASLKSHRQSQSLSRQNRPSA